MRQRNYFCLLASFRNHFPHSRLLKHKKENIESPQYGRGVRIILEDNIWNEAYCYGYVLKIQTVTFFHTLLLNEKKMEEQKQRTEKIKRGQEDENDYSNNRNIVEVLY